MNRSNRKPSQKSARRFSKRAVQDRLDLAAEYMEREGHHDLAAKLDYYCAKLDGCKPDEIPLIKRALARVLEEGRSRIPQQKKEQLDRVDKARVATRRARRAAESKKAAIKRRLKAIASKRKKAKDMLASFRDGRKDRLRKRAAKLRRTKNS